METLKISTNNFWVKYYKFIFILDRYKENLPKDTCTFRRDLIFGTLIAVLLLPIIILGNILKVIFEDGLDAQSKYIVLVSFLVLMGISFLTVANEWNREFFFLLTLKLNGLVLLMILIIVLVLIIGVGLVSLIEYIGDNFSKNKPQKEKFVFFKEMYRSAKEKYCKKIEYVN